MHLKLLLTLLCLTHLGHCAKILAVVLTPSYSHQVAFRPIWRELSLRGHNVTLITTDPINDPSLVNLTEIDLHDSMYEMWEKVGVVSVLKECTYKPWKFIFAFWDIMQRISETIQLELLSNPGIRALLSGDDSFDLVMVEPASFLSFVFSEIYKGKLILVMSFEPFSYIHSALGNAVHPIVYPEGAFLGAPKTLLQRIIAVLYYSIEYYIHEFGVSLLENHVCNNISSLGDILQRVNMVFVNVNPLFGYMRPVTPSIVYFGRASYHQPMKELPKDLKEFLDRAENGAVYFSLGSNAKSKDLSFGTRTAILDALKDLPFRFLWKYEDHSLENVPDNVKIAKWFPQQDILRHPNIKAFITQGGLQSMEEAIFNRVPMIGIPQFGDQIPNIDRVVELGLGVKLNADTLTKENLKGAILEIVTNSSYRNNIQEFAKLSSDWPMSDIDKVVWWTEYVLRNNNTEHLKGPARKVPTYQYLFLDVIATVLVVVVVLVYLFVKLVKLIFKGLVRGIYTKVHEE